MLNEHNALMLQRVHTFAQTEVNPEATQWSTGALPNAALWQRAAELNLYGMEVPTQLGGLGLGFVTKAKIGEILAGADFGFAMSVINTQNVARNLTLGDNTRLQQLYLPRLLRGEISACTALTEPDTGSDFAAIQTTATQAPDHWVLNGEKTWIINGRHATLAIVFAQCARAGDRDGIAAFLVNLDRAGCRRYAKDSAIQQASMGTGGFVLDNCRVPLDHCLVSPGQAFHAIMTEINGARAYVAAMCVGMLDAALRCAQAYGQSRKTFGQPLHAHQAWRLTLARAATDLAAMRALVDQAAQALEQPGDAQLLCAQAKVFAVEACRQQLPRLLHAMGAHGLSPEYPMVRHSAAVSMAALTDGSDEMLLERIALLTRPRSV